MTNKPDLMTEKNFTPETIAEHGSFSRQEKLDRLNEMKFDLERQTGRGTADLEQVEQRMASLNIAISKVKRESADGGDSAALGRTPNA